jgi:hypothetical protein
MGPPEGVTAPVVGGGRHSAIKSPLRRGQVRGMIRIALSDAAYDAISSTLPKGSARWPMQRDHGQCFIQVESAIVDRMRAMRRPGESYSYRHPAARRTSVAQTRMDRA